MTLWWWAWVVWGALVAWMVCAVAHDARAEELVHNDQIIKCDRNLTYEEADKIGEVTNANNTVSEYYDTNRDGLVDIETLSYITDYDSQGELVHDRFPFMWIVDIDFDAVPDKSYVDVGGHGRCDEIHFYQDLHGPKAPWPDPDTGRREGRL